MSKEWWLEIYEEKLAEAEERGIKHPEEWAATEATEELRDQMAMQADQLYDDWRDRGIP